MAFIRKTRRVLRMDAFAYEHVCGQTRKKQLRIGIIH